MTSLSPEEIKRLPAWAEPHPTAKNAILVDPDKMYPAFLAEYGIEKPNRYWLEVCFQSMKMDLQVALRRPNFVIHMRADGERKQKWNYSMFPGTDGWEGKAVDDPMAVKAARGGEAREQYRRIRGFVPG